MPRTGLFAVIILLVVLLAGCAAPEQARVIYLDPVLSAEQTDSLPPPHDDVQAGNEGQLLVSFMNGLGDQPIEFSITVRNETESWELWSNEPMVSGFDPFQDHDKETVLRATKLALVRLPVGEVEVECIIDGVAQRRVFDIKGSEVQNSIVYATVFGIVIITLDEMKELLPGPSDRDY